ncbi:MAG: thioredoxin family protein [Desulfobacterales bacterium]|nr:thioredoxin family protein [Desulfobacterales bacterium]
MIVAAQKVTQIRVKGNLVGIVGLQDVMEAMKPDYSEQSDEVIGKEMISRLAAHNYIPDSARENYARALVREFRIFLGQPVEEEKLEGLEVLILGPGCAQCSRLEADVRDVMAQMNVPGELIHVTDLREIGKYGVMGTPALVINRKVVSVGTTPEKKKIRQWLEEAIGKQG